LQKLQIKINAQTLQAQTLATTYLSTITSKYHTIMPVRSQHVHNLKVCLWSVSLWTSHAYLRYFINCQHQTTFDMIWYLQLYSCLTVVNILQKITKKVVYSLKINHHKNTSYAISGNSYTPTMFIQPPNQH